MTLRLLLVAVALAVPAGCCTALYNTAGASPEQLVARASFDLDCPRDQLVVVDLDARTRGVNGCGRRATYVEQCQRYGDLGHKEGCSWVMNVEQAPKPPAAGL